MPKIKKVFARSVFDSRGIPTVEAEVTTEQGLFSAIVPSGTSSGKHEALELRDGGKEFGGKGVKKAVENVNKIIAPKLVGRDFASQNEVDDFLLSLDGTQNKSRLGANAILSVSTACLRGGAAEQNLSDFEYLAKIFGTKKTVLPCPMSVFISGGAHADKSTDFQEYMVMPLGAKSFSHAMQMIAEIYQALGSILKKKGFHTNVGKEGSFAPSVDSNKKPFDFFSQAVKEAGYTEGKDVFYSLDVAASEFYSGGKYVLKTEGKSLSGGELGDYYADLVKTFPIVSIEDGFAEDDFESFSAFTKKLGARLQIVGDDLLVTNVERIKKAVQLKSCNSLLLKPNQIGTVSETLDAAKLAFENKWSVVVSHRSGDTEDYFISDLAVGIGCGQIKPGAPARSDRTAKYNRLLRIEEKLGSRAEFAGKKFLSGQN